MHNFANLVKFEKCSSQKASIQPRTSPKKFGKTGKRDFEISFALTPVRAFEIEGRQGAVLLAAAFFGSKPGDSTRVLGVS